MRATDYGLIGYPLGHSLSPFIHQGILAAAGLPGTYRLYDITAEQLAVTVRRLSAELVGFNCTIPYKETIIPCLTSLDETAGRIRSVNTIAGDCGFNTDYAAFQQACPLPQGASVLILGAGGVSRTMAFAAADRGCAISIVSRRSEQARQLAAAVRQQVPAADLSCPESLAEWRRTAARPVQDVGQQTGWIVLNGTPVGMWPHVAGMPLDKADLDFISYVYDTIYNPVATRLVLAARSRGIPAAGGQGMLFNQALSAQKIWNPQAVFAEEAMRQVQQALTRAILRQSPLQILLCGFMGSGKTTVGSQLAGHLGLPFLDLDALIEQAADRTIPELFADDGEQAFRALERSMLIKTLEQADGLVLATGGGALLGDGIEDLRQDWPALIIHLDVSYATVRQRVGQGAGRPMLTGLDGAGWEQLYRQRQPRYQAIADLTVNGNDWPEVVVDQISRKLGLEETS